MKIFSEWRQYFHWRLSVPVSDLGYSRSVLPVYGRPQSKWDPRRHNCVLILRCYEIPLHCRRQYGCALPEDEVVSRVFVLFSWQNPRIFLHWTISGMMVWEVLKLQKITDDFEDFLLQRIHITLSPSRYLILDFFFFPGMTALMFFISICYSFCYLFPLEGQGSTAVWQFPIMSL